MHQVYFVVSLKEEDRMDKAIPYANDYAESVLYDEGFCSNGYFTCGKADWFEVGGRWKYDFTGFRLYGHSAHTEMEKRTGKSMWGDDEPEWVKIKEECGNPQKSALLTPSLARFIMDNYEETEFFDAENYEESDISHLQAFLDNKDEDEEYMITLIDYHN